MSSILESQLLGALEIQTKSIVALEKRLAAMESKLDSRDFVAVPVGDDAVPVVEEKGTATSKLLDASATPPPSTVTPTPSPPQKHDLPPPKPSPSATPAQIHIDGYLPLGDHPRRVILPGFQALVHEEEEEQFLADPRATARALPTEAADPAISFNGLISDAGLHIDAHFIGNHIPATRRDFTWIQASPPQFLPQDWDPGPPRRTERRRRRTSPPGTGSPSKGQRGGHPIQRRHFGKALPSIATEDHSESVATTTATKLLPLVGLGEHNALQQTACNQDLDNKPQHAPTGGDWQSAHTTFYGGSDASRRISGDQQLRPRISSTSPSLPPPLWEPPPPPRRSDLAPPQWARRQRQGTAPQLIHEPIHVSTHAATAVTTTIDASSDSTSDTHPNCSIKCSLGVVDVLSVTRVFVIPHQLVDNSKHAAATQTSMDLVPCNVHTGTPTKCLMSGLGIGIASAEVAAAPLLVVGIYKDVAAPVVESEVYSSKLLAGIKLGPALPAKCPMNCFGYSNTVLHDAIGTVLTSCPDEFSGDPVVQCEPMVKFVDWQPWPPPIPLNFLLDCDMNCHMLGPYFVASAAVLVGGLRCLLLYKETSAECFTHTDNGAATSFVFLITEDFVFDPGISVVALHLALNIRIHFIMHHLLVWLGWKICCQSGLLEILWSKAMGIDAVQDGTAGMFLDVSCLSLAILGSAATEVNFLCPSDLHQVVWYIQVLGNILAVIIGGHFLTCHEEVHKYTLQNKLKAHQLASHSKWLLEARTGGNISAFVDTNFWSLSTRYGTLLKVQLYYSLSGVQNYYVYCGIQLLKENWPIYLQGACVVIRAIQRQIDNMADYSQNMQLLQRWKPPWTVASFVSGQIRIWKPP